MNTSRAYSDATGVDFIAQLAALAQYKLRGPETMARVKARSFQRIHRAIAPLLGGTVTGRSIVEIGSGQWMANAKLFSALGARVLAVDPEIPPVSFRDYGRYAKDLGVQRAAKTLAGAVLFGARFDAELAWEAGIPFKRPAFARWQGGAEDLPWRDGEADAVVSDNVFEHLPDVASVVSEMARVLAPGGVACVTIHPFTAFSGGHHPATIAHAGEAFEPTIPPWDHLRANGHPSGVYLNRVRIRDFRSILESRFETITWHAAREAEHLLTSQIEAELSAYTRDELLTGKLFFLGRKR